VTGADNQQERLDAEWIVGFVDGEGCFHVALNKLQKMTLGWQVLPEFRVVQHQRDEAVLHKIKSFFGFGSVKVNNGTRKEFRARGLNNLNKLIEFFKKHPLQTSKKKSFEIFSEIIVLMNQKQHLTREGLEKIADLASKMNRKVIRHLESSETIRQKHSLKEC
jgi:predicted transcriptional regulator